MLMFSVAAHAQQTAPAAPAPADQSDSQQVVVTGIRASLESAINIKRNSEAVVDSLSAEDIGKLPDDD